MSNMNVKFIGKEYSIPEDVLTYIDLLDFTDSVHKYLSSTNLVPATQDATVSMTDSIPIFIMLIIFTERK